VAFSLLESMASAILVYTKILCTREFVEKIFIFPYTQDII
jgi:hypothetical protein